MSTSGSIFSRTVVFSLFAFVAFLHRGQTENCTRSRRSETFCICFFFITPFYWTKSEHPIISYFFTSLSWWLCSFNSASEYRWFVIFAYFVNKLWQKLLLHFFDILNIPNPNTTNNYHQRRLDSQGSCCKNLKETPVLK